MCIPTFNLHSNMKAVVFTFKCVCSQTLKQQGFNFRHLSKASAAFIELHISILIGGASYLMCITELTRFIKWLIKKSATKQWNNDAVKT